MTYSVSMNASRYYARVCSNTFHIIMIMITVPIQQILKEIIISSLNTFCC